MYSMESGNTVQLNKKQQQQQQRHHLTFYEIVYYYPSKAHNLFTSGKKKYIIRSRKFLKMNHK